MVIGEIVVYRGSINQPGPICRPVHDLFQKMKFKKVVQFPQGLYKVWVKSETKEWVNLMNYPEISDEGVQYLICLFQHQPLVPEVWQW